MVESLSVEALHDNFDDFFVIDVREDEEYASEHIDGTMTAPLSEPLRSFQSEGKTIVFMCRSGKRSLMAAQKYLFKNPSDTVYNLTGGILAWGEQGYPVVEA